MIGQMPNKGMGGMPMPEGQQEAAPEQPKEGGSATQLLIGANSALNKLAALIDKSPLPEQDKAKFDQIMAAFQDFADGLGESPNQPAPKAPPGPVPYESMGKPGVKPAVF